MIDLVPGFSALFGLIGFFIGLAHGKMFAALSYGFIGLVVGVVVGTVVSFVVNAILPLQNFILQGMVIGTLVGVILLIFGIICDKKKLMMGLIVFPIVGGVLGVICNAVSWMADLSNYFLQGISLGTIVGVIGISIGIILFILDFIHTKEKCVEFIFIFSCVFLILGVLFAFLLSSFLFVFLFDVGLGLIICLVFIVMSYFVYKVDSRKRLTNYFFSTASEKIETLIRKSPYLKDHTDILAAREDIHVTCQNISFLSEKKWYKNIQPLNKAIGLVDSLSAQNDRLLEIKQRLGKLEDEKYAEFYKDEFQSLSLFKEDISKISLLEEGHKALLSKIRTYQQDVKTLEQYFFVCDDLLRELDDDVHAQGIRQQIDDIRTRSVTPGTIAEVTATVMQRLPGITTDVKEYSKKKQQWLTLSKTLRGYEDDLRCVSDSNAVLLMTSMQPLETMEFTYENLGILQKKLPEITGNYQNYLKKMDALKAYRDQLSTYMNDPFVMASCHDVIAELQDKCTDTQYLENIPPLFLKLKQELSKQNKMIYDELLTNLHSSVFYDDIIEKIEVLYKNLGFNYIIKSELLLEIQSRNNFWNERERRYGLYKEFVNAVEKTWMNEWPSFYKKFINEIQDLFAKVRIQKDLPILDKIENKIQYAKKCYDFFVHIKEKKNFLLKEYPEFVHKYKITEQWGNIEEFPSLQNVESQLNGLCKLVSEGKELVIVYKKTKSFLLALKRNKEERVDFGMVSEYYDKNEIAKNSVDKNSIKKINKSLELFHLQFHQPYHNPLGHPRTTDSKGRPNSPRNRFTGF